MDYKFPSVIESIPLEVKAIDTAGREYSVILRSGINGKVVLDILGTPGKWYISSLGRDPRSSIYIDRGAEWICTNFGDVMKNALETFDMFKKKNIPEIFL
jgi:hypothetical protein